MSSRRDTLLYTSLSLGLSSANYQANAEMQPASLYDFSAKMFDEEKPLKAFDGEVTVIVNVASE